MFLVSVPLQAVCVTHSLYVNVTVLRHCLSDRAGRPSSPEKWIVAAAACVFGDQHSSGVGLRDELISHAHYITTVLDLVDIVAELFVG